MTAIAIQTTSLAANDNLDTILNDFVAYIDADSPATITTYKRAIRQFWNWTQGNGMAATGRETVTSWRESLKLDHKPSTIALYLAAIRRFVGWATATGRMSQAAADGVKAVKSPKLTHDFKRDYLTVAQIKDLLASIDTASLAGKRDRAMIALMATCGLRDVEVSRAKVSDMRLRAGEIVLAIHGKGHTSADALVKIAPEVEKLIRVYLAARNDNNPNIPLFASHAHRNAGCAMTTRAISGIVKNRIRSIGLDSDRLSSHSLRHSAATLALKAGCPLPEVQAMMRHSNISTTMIYSHVLDIETRQAEAKIAAAIF